jgi:hypothetical protein
MYRYPKTVTPLSARGPMCSGGILALVSKRIPLKHWDALICAKLGRLGLVYSPFNEGSPTQGDLNGEAGTSCPHRNCGVAYCDPFHVLTECTHPRLAELRDNLVARAGAIAHAILMVKSGGEPDPAVETFSALPDAWTSRAGRFMMFRLLTATPWSHKDVARGHAGHAEDDGSAVLWYHLPAFLATFFDTALRKTHTLRPLANMWVEAAGSGWARIADVWRTHLGSTSGRDDSDDSADNSDVDSVTSDNSSDSNCSTPGNDADDNGPDHPRTAVVETNAVPFNFIFPPPPPWLTIPGWQQGTFGQTGPG